ncbi:MAG: hypothetical protein PHI85_07885 [Victivallaceae bacterium]|nr:hypothetical protein [Victivallaceae bacterium]
MREILSAKIQLPSGGFYGYTAIGGYAAAQLAKIAGICGTEIFAGGFSPPPGSACCVIEEITRAEVDRHTPVEPDKYTLFEPSIIIKIDKATLNARVYIVPSAAMTGEKTGFLWRRLYYLPLLSLVTTSATCVAHGVLAEFKGSGVIVSGPSGIGKSTASRRLPPPWNVLADDCMIVQKLPDGFHASPVPTWSLYYTSGGMARRFACERSIKLASLFLLDRGTDRVEPITHKQAIIGFTRSIGDMTKILTGRLPDPARQTVFDRGFAMASEIAGELQVRHLYATLTGNFWSGMEAAATGAEQQ